VRLSLSSWRNHERSRFELAHIWATIRRLAGASPSRSIASRAQITQAPEVRVKKDAMDAVVSDGQEERCEWCVLVVEDERRLSIELVHFDFQIRAAASAPSVQ
jgi:head-tail adaptor